MKGVYDATRKLRNERPKRVDTVKDREGKLLSQENEVEDEEEVMAGTLHGSAEQG